MAQTSGRMLALLSLLQARRDWPGPLLAERLAVSERTVRRDVDRLRALGYRVTAAKGPDGGYRLDSGSELPPLLFDDEQAVALAVVLPTAAALGAGLEDAAQRALATVRQVMPARLRQRIDALQVETATDRAAPEVDPATLLAVGAAVQAQEVLRFDYGDAGASAPPRRAEPHHLVARRGRWYLVAWDLDRADWRVFRADRIAPSSHRGARFARRTVPGGDVGAFLEGRFRGADGPGDWPCRGRAVLAVPAAALAPYLREDVLEDLGDGRCRLTAGAWSWIGLAARMLAPDADLSEVEPAALRRAFAALAARATSASLR